MKYILSILLILFVMPSAYSADSFPVLKLLKKDKFIISKKNLSGKKQRLYIYNGHELQAYAMVVKCKKSSCLVKVTKEFETLNFQKNMEVLSRMKPEEVKIEKGVYAGVGGTLSVSMQVGYWTKLTEKIQIEAAYEYLSTNLGNVGVSGHGLTVGTKYKWRDTGKLDYSIGTKGTGTLATLDFSAVSATENFVTDPNFVLSFDIYNSFDYQFMDNMKASLGIGYTYNTFDLFYVDEVNASNYSTPFSGGSVLINFYLYYQF